MEFGFSRLSTLFREFMQTLDFFYSIEFVLLLTSCGKGMVRVWYLVFVELSCQIYQKRPGNVAHGGRVGAHARLGKTSCPHMDFCLLLVEFVMSRPAELLCHCEYRRVIWREKQAREGKEGKKVEYNGAIHTHTS